MLSTVLRSAATCSGIAVACAASTRRSWSSPEHCPIQPHDSHQERATVAAEPVGAHTHTHPHTHTRAYARAHTDPHKRPQTQERVQGRIAVLLAPSHPSRATPAARACSQHSGDSTRSARLRSAPLRARRRRHCVALLSQHTCAPVLPSCSPACRHPALPDAAKPSTLNCPATEIFIARAQTRHPASPHAGTDVRAGKEKRQRTSNTPSTFHTAVS